MSTELNIRHQPKFLCCWVLLSSIFVGCILVGCGAPKPTFRNPPPDAWYPEQFRDIFLPPFYEIQEDCDQLAISFAGGAIRHFDATMMQVDDEKGLSGKELLQWYHTQLKVLGWIPVTDSKIPSNTRQYNKTNSQLGSTKEERLELKTGRAHKHNIIR
ncbi:MAG: hypothetical protein HRU15_07810, partial [Planctomycetes bacterium]|nr:hypothetical protein [Planctomycetota bacterium]